MGTERAEIAQVALAVKATHAALTQAALIHATSDLLFNAEYDGMPCRELL